MIDDVNPVRTSICAEDRSRVALSVDETVAFYRRHHSITSHDVKWVRTDLDVPEATSETDPGGLIGELQGQFEDGVPIGVVAAAMGERGHTIGETMAAIRELWMADELYEPQMITSARRDSRGLRS